MRKRKVARYGYLMISILFCLAGLAYWLFPICSPVVACWISGGILILYGIIRIIGFFSDDPYCLAFHYDLAIGLLLIVLGFLIWFKRTSAYLYLVTGFAWIALLDSLFKIQLSKEARDFGLNQWKAILPFGILTAFNSLLLVLNCFSGSNAEKGLTGLVLLLEGILNWFTVQFTVKR